MPMSVVYATVNGRLVQENRGGVVTRYVADTLGSVIQTRDASGNQTSSTTYWPFGEVRTSSGTNPSPWGFCGIWGYFTDAVNRLYVRARNLRADLSRWMTPDPLWPRQPVYSYVDGQATIYVDPTGEQMLIGCLLSCWGYPGGPCAWAKAQGHDNGDYGGVICCAGKKHACAWNIPPGTRPGVVHCIKEHERHHFDDVPCNSDGRPGWNPGANKVGEECKSYTVEILCYTDARARECGKLTGAARKKCEADYRWWICDACRAAKAEGCTLADLPRQCKYCP